MPAGASPPRPSLLSSPPNDGSLDAVRRGEVKEEEERRSPRRPFFFGRGPNETNLSGDGRTDGRERMIAPRY